MILVMCTSYYSVARLGKDLDKVWQLVASEFCVYRSSGYNMIDILLTYSILCF